MIFAFWCRLTGGHDWRKDGWSGVAFCERCGSLKFEQPQIPPEVWRRLAQHIAAEIAASRINRPIAESEQAH